MKQDFYREYMDSVYGAANDLTAARFDAASLDFEAQYGPVLPLSRQAGILDVGCGAGHFLYFLDKKGYVNYEGIDVSPQQVAYCRAHVTSRVEVADMFTYLEKKQAAYDFILAHDVLEHVDKACVVDLVKRFRLALKPGGVLVARVPNMSNPFGLHGRYIDLTHELGFTERSLYQLFYVGGFRSIELKGALCIRKKTWRSFLRRAFLTCYYAWIRWLYFVQDYSVPNILDHDLVVLARKQDEDENTSGQ